MKKVSVSLVIVLLLGIGVLSVAIAAPLESAGYYCPYLQQEPTLTEDQRQQLSQWQNQMTENRKQMLQKQVEWGWITQEQANQQINYMQQWPRNGYGMWMMGARMNSNGMGHGMRAHGSRGHGLMWGGHGYYSPYSHHAANLTAEQQEQIKEWQNQMMDNRKQMLQKQVEWGWITQEQADQQITYMQQWHNNGYGMWMMNPGMMDRDN